MKTTRTLGMLLLACLLPWQGAQAALSIDGSAMSLSGTTYTYEGTLTQGHDYTISGEADVADAAWYCDPDFFSRNADGTFRFLPMTGTYRLEADMGKRAFIVTARHGSDIATMDYTSTTKAIWAYKNGCVGKPVYGDWSGWLCLAQRSQGIFQLTLTAGQQMNASNLSFFLSPAAAWYPHYISTVTEEGYCIRSMDDRFTIDGANITPASGFAPADGHTYVFTFDARNKRMLKMYVADTTAGETIPSFDAPDPDRNYGDQIVGAYVTSWGPTLPDPHSVTHIFYAFALIDGAGRVVLDLNDDPASGQRLQQVVALKQQNPALKVLISVGGATCTGWPAIDDDGKRATFVSTCMQLVDDYGLDGIDIDWEYPRENAHFESLMATLRERLGTSRLLTMATDCQGMVCQVDRVAKYCDLINIMSYDMGATCQSALYPSDHMKSIGAQWFCTGSEAVERHMAMGATARQLVYGIPFYGRGSAPGTDQGTLTHQGILDNIANGYVEHYDDVAKLAYFLNESGQILENFENERSVAEKCAYAKAEGLAGVMYWELDQDDSQHTLGLRVAKEVLGYEPTAIEPAVAAGSTLPFRASADQGTIVVTAAQDGVARLYDASGTLLALLPVTAHTPCRTPQLPTGLYMVRMGDRATKLALHR